MGKDTGVMLEFGVTISLWVPVAFSHSDVNTPGSSFFSYLHRFLDVSEPWHGPMDQRALLSQ